MSGGDADFWRRQLSSFGTASAGLCEAVAALARRLCTEYVDPSVLEAFVANRLIPLDKRPGTRPIGIGEMPRRIIGKAVAAVLENDIMDAAGGRRSCVQVSARA